MNKRNLVLALPLAIVALALAAPAGTKLFVNGKATENGAISQNGKTYVSLDALKAAGAEVTLSTGKVMIQFKPFKDQMQVDAVEGAMGEWIQNEGWRVKVHSVAKADKSPFGKGTGMTVKFEWRNLTNKPMNFGTSGLRQFQLLDENGKALAISNSSFKDQYTTCAPGNGFINDLAFGTPAGDVSPVGKPAKIVIVFGQSGKNKFKNIRIDVSGE